MNPFSIQTPPLRNPSLYRSKHHTPFAARLRLFAIPAAPQRSSNPWCRKNVGNVVPPWNDTKGIKYCTNRCNSDPKPNQIQSKIDQNQRRPSSKRWLMAEKRHSRADLRKKSSPFRKKFLQNQPDLGNIIARGGFLGDPHRMSRLQNLPTPHPAPTRQQPHQPTLAALTGIAPEQTKGIAQQ